MKKQTSTILASVLCFILVSITHSTIAQQVRTSQTNRGSVAQPKTRAAATPQEEVVRAVYNKLTALNRASNNIATTDDSLDGMHSRDVRRGGGRLWPRVDTRALCGRNLADRRLLQRSRRSTIGTVPRGPAALPKRRRWKALRHLARPMREVRT